MPKYEVQGEMTISVTVYVDADSEEEAREKAEDAAVYGLCNHCSRGEKDEWSPSSLDGDVMITGVEEMD